MRYNESEGSLVLMRFIDRRAAGCGRWAGQTGEHMAFQPRMTQQAAGQGGVSSSLRRVAIGIPPGSADSSVAQN